MDHPRKLVGTTYLADALDTYAHLALARARRDDAFWALRVHRNKRKEQHKWLCVDADKWIARQLAPKSPSASSDLGSVVDALRALGVELGNIADRLERR